MRNVLLFVLTCTLAMLFYSCSSNLSSEIDEVAVLDYDPCIVGDFHNTALEYLISNVPDKQANTPIEGIEYLRNAYLEILGDYNFTSKTTMYTSSISNSVLLYVANPDFQNTREGEIEDKIEDLFELKLIDENEKSLMTQAFVSAGNLDKLQKLLDTWNSLNYDTTEGQGAISKATICLSISSTEFWNNIKLGDGEVVTRISPAHVDVGGFIVGAALTAWSQDDLGWEDVPNIIAGGVITGVVSSSGVARSIGRWLFGL